MGDDVQTTICVNLAKIHHFTLAKHIVNFLGCVERLPIFHPMTILFLKNIVSLALLKIVWFFQSLSTPVLVSNRFVKIFDQQFAHSVHAMRQ